MNLSHVRAGDKVMRTWGQDGLKLFEVARVTPKYIMLKGSHGKWRVSDGGVVNGGRHPRTHGPTQGDSIQPFNEAIWMRYVRHMAHEAQLSDIGLHDPLDQATTRKMHELFTHHN